MKTAEARRGGHVRGFLFAVVPMLCALPGTVAAQHPPSSVHGCGAAMPDEGARLRVRCLTDVLLSANGATDDAVVASALDGLRSLRERASPAADAISQLLSHRSPLFRDRDKRLVVRLRAYVLLTLSDIGVPPSAQPALLDIVAHVDERMSALEIGAAVRAVRSLSARGCVFAPYLIGMLATRITEEEFSLERYEPVFPPHEATTIQLEVVRALGQVCVPQDHTAVDALRRFAGHRGDSLDRRVVEEARATLTRIGEAP